jgi:menaquinone-dependent protoporphyrinogen IX oxidase
MTVLVAAASKHGSTDEIAVRIGADLLENGLEVEVKKIEEVGDLSGYQAFVLGSGIYLGNWLKNPSQNDGCSLLKQTRQQARARKASWMS